MLEYNHRNCKGVGSMKKALAMVFSAFMSIGAGGQGYVLGDVDGNGVIDGADASLVLSVYAETSVGTDSRLTDSQTLAADADENHIVDGSDASWILSYYAYISVHGGGEMDLRRFVKGEEKDISVKYDNSLENITKSADVFNYHAECLNGEILKNNLFDMYDCDGIKYIMNGNRESKVALLLLNADQQYNFGVISKVFEDYNDYELKNGILFFYRIPQIESHIKVDIDFNNYALDKNVGTYMNNLKNAAKIARETGDYNGLNNILYAFQNDENYRFLWDNYAAFMLTLGYGSEMKENAYYEVYCGSEDFYTNIAYELIKKRIVQSTGG